MATEIKTCGYCEKPIDPNDIQNACEGYDEFGFGTGEYCHRVCLEIANDLDFIYRPPSDEPMKAPTAICQNNT